LRRRTDHVLDGQVLEVGGKLFDREGLEGAGALGEQAGGLRCRRGDRFSGIKPLPLITYLSWLARSWDKCNAEEGGQKVGIEARQFPLAACPHADHTAEAGVAG